MSHDNAGHIYLFIKLLFAPRVTIVICGRQIGQLARQQMHCITMKRPPSEQTIHICIFELDMDANQVTLWLARVKICRFWNYISRIVTAKFVNSSAILGWSYCSVSIFHAPTVRQINCRENRRKTVKLHYCGPKGTTKKLDENLFQLDQIHCMLHALWTNPK